MGPHSWWPGTLPALEPWHVPSGVARGAQGILYERPRRVPGSRLGDVGGRVRELHTRQHHPRRRRLRGRRGRDSVYGAARPHDPLGAPGQRADVPVPRADLAPPRRTQDMTQNGLSATVALALVAILGPAHAAEPPPVPAGKGDFPWIKFAEDLGELTDLGRSYAASIVPPAEKLTRLAYEVMQITPPNLIGSVSTIAFVRLKPEKASGGVNALFVGNGAMIVDVSVFCQPNSACMPDLDVSATSLPDFPGAFIHETAHAYGSLLLKLAQGADISALGNAAARRAATVAADQFGLRGATNLWTNWWGQIQSSGQRAGLAGYTNDAMAGGGNGGTPTSSLPPTCWCAPAAPAANAPGARPNAPPAPKWQQQYPTNVAAQKQGFARAYGASMPMEDFATFVEELIFPASRRLPQFCDEFSRLAAEPAPVLKPYQTVALVKLLTLRYLGLYGDAELQRCVPFGLAESRTPGIHYNVGAPGYFLFDQGLKAWWKKESGSEMLELLATSGEFKMAIFVKAPNRNPLGLHVLRNSWIVGSEGLGLERVTYAVDNANQKSKTSVSGVVVVTASTVDGQDKLREVRGFMLNLQLASTLTRRISSRPIFSTFWIRQ